MKQKALCALVFSALLSVPAVASAHVELQSPKARWTDQKAGPCGRANGQRTTNVSTFKPGQTITVEWEETVPHPGHYRIAFDTDGQDDFEDPDSFDDITSGGPEVLVDGIADRGGTEKYTQTITFPNVECDNCTLQLIQVMTDKPPYDGDDIYYQCADIVLSNGATGTNDGGTRPPAGGDDDDNTSDGDDDRSGDDDDSTSRRVPKSTPEASGCVTTPGSFGASGTTCLVVLGAAALSLTRRRRK